METTNMAIIKKTLSALTSLLLLTAIRGAGSLVIEHMQIGSVCPRLLGIPACFLIFFFALGGLIFQLLQKKRALWLMIAPPFLIALYASIMQISQLAQCPKTDGGIAMCYLSLTIFGSIVVIQIIGYFLDKKN